VQVLHTVGQFLLPDEPLKGRDLLVALDAARAELMAPVGQRIVPYTFEATVVDQARRDGFTRDGVQHLSNGE